MPRRPPTLRLRAAARSDALGGALLLGATVAAVILANSPAADAYAALRDLMLGPLSVGYWAESGLLAVFFFVVGLELKHELVNGRLRNPRASAVPIAGAVGGVIVPALLFLAVAGAGGTAALRGWAIPTATDIAFALAVFAIVARRLPAALRVFLLTLAIVDDLIAITIIATVYTDDLRPLWLLAAIVPLAGFGMLVRHRGALRWAAAPLAIAVWALVYASGVHATVAGVLLAFAVPARPEADAPEGLAAHLAHRWSPASTLVAVPVFAFFSAGVAVGSLDGLRVALADPVAIGVIVGLVLGKPLGILAGVFAVTRIRSIRADTPLRWPDLAGVAMLAGIGFTVALLVVELSYPDAPATAEAAKLGVLLGSSVAAMAGGVLLALRSRR